MSDRAAGGWNVMWGLLFVLVGIALFLVQSALYGRIWAASGRSC